MNPRELRRALSAEAQRLGLGAPHVARAEALDRDAARLEEWLAGGLHREMQYMERAREERGDPRKLLPGCRSVVTVALDYWDGEPAPADRRGRVARYAWGRDYHKVLGKRLRRLAEWLGEASGEAARSFVDTGPVLERAWVERSGMGWIGKNANAIRREGGSWFLIGELLSAAEIEIDPAPHADFCGSCTACIDACPTDAIVADGVVDSGRCISYWTIEHRGSVDTSIRSGMGPWIFGCDICQEVCPWNRSFAQEDSKGPFEYRDELRGLDPVEILRMSEAEFRDRYSGTPLMRAKWQGMRRNACIVLGNSGDTASIPALQAAAEDADTVVAEHAAWALVQLRRKA